VKFTLSWLREHIDTPADTARIAETLTGLGLEVEAIEDRAAELAPFVTARVVEAVRHPNADKLRVCRVDTGDGEPVQVVCGAPNARSGMVAVFARAGTTVPATGTVLKIGEIRGQVSNGMLVSEREMGLSDEHNGIIEMPEGTPIGVPFAPLMGFDDPVIEIAVTPNRPDCLGVSGIARDLAATEIGTAKTPKIKPVRGAFPCPTAIRIEVEDPALCPLFALRLVRGVKNGPSPEWMQKRLIAVGLRPINALVDITNLITLDRGRPLHVFDAAKVAGDLVVRRAAAGESFLALGGREYTLDPIIVVIADDNGVESLGGIMGGEATGCGDDTVDVLIESALWDPLNIARTGRSLGIHSDARHRFERGVDPAMAVPGLDLATALVLELCGGEASETVIVGDRGDDRPAIDFPYSEVKRLTGLDLHQAEIRLILQRLGFFVSGQGDTAKVAAPSWRPDIEGKADLVEEVMRVVGVDRVASTPLPRPGHIARTALTPLQVRTRTARRTFAARGLVEAVTWSFIPHRAAELFGGGQSALQLANPIAADLSDMRPSLIPGLAAAAQRNADRGAGDVALFEVGQIFRGVEPEDQRLAATVIRRGGARPFGRGRHWVGAAGTVSAFDAKADAIALLTALGLPVDKLQIVQGAPEHFHPGRSGTIQLGPQNVFGHFGELHPRTLKALDVSGPIAAVEILLDALPPVKSRPTRTKPPLERVDLQPVARDFAFLVGRDVAAGDVVKAALAADRKLITDVEVFDVYEGIGVPEGQKSVAIEVRLQPRDKTLTDGEIEAVSGRVVAGVAKATGGTLRG
jgi:phenylalanyl-tRNA synthetase beta chain